MGEPRLCGLAMLHVHYTRKLNHEAVIKRFVLIRRIVSPELFASTESSSEEASDSDGEEA